MGRVCKLCGSSTLPTSSYRTSFTGVWIRNFFRTWIRNFLYLLSRIFSTWYPEISQPQFRIFPIFRFGFELANTGHDKCSFKHVYFFVVVENTGTQGKLNVQLIVEFAEGLLFSVTDRCTYWYILVRNSAEFSLKSMRMGAQVRNIRFLFRFLTKVVSYPQQYRVPVPSLEKLHIAPAFLFYTFMCL
jgi:hypothetical protein